MESASLMQMNSLLRDAHIERIRMTPFHWCVQILNPIEVNLKLLKEMLKRWSGNDLCFRVSQQLVPFNVVDVFMATGLGMGGLDVPFEECLVGSLGQILNSKTTTKKDLIDMFNLIVKDDEIHVDIVCRLYILLCLVTFFCQGNLKMSQTSLVRC